MRKALLFLMLLGMVSTAASAEDKPAASSREGFQRLEESAAYRQYLHRPQNDLSKLIFLIDRFAQARVEIIYDGFHFPAPQAAGVARWFLARNYKKQTPEEWIYQWCNQTVPRGNLVLVKMPDGSVELGRQVLLDELAALERLQSSPAA